jgi:Transcriptional Coactivator p15 (PC4)
VQSFARGSVPGSSIKEWIIEMAEKTDVKALVTKTTSKSKDVVVAKWRVTKRELLLVTVGRFKGRKLVGVRRWYRDAQGELCPGKGISLRPDDLKRVRKALRKADRLLRGRQ